MAHHDEPRKRSIVAISEKLLDARRMLLYLRHHGIDVKKVSRHSLQVIPEQEQAAKELMEFYRWDWEDKK
jgi:hypothetical protein